MFANDPNFKGGEIYKKFGAEYMDIEKAENIDCVILAVPHSEFEKIKLSDMKKWMKIPVLVDIKSHFNKGDAQDAGFVYISL